MHFKRGSTSKQGDSASYSASILVEYASKMQSWRLNSLMVFLIMLVICARCRCYTEAVTSQMSINEIYN